MKVTLKNNSCSGLNRRYHKYTLDLKGHATLKGHIVPDHIADDLFRYLKRHHPAVEITVEDVPTGLSLVKSVPVLSPAAVTADKTVVDINVDEEDAPSVTVEEHLRSLGLISDPAPAETPDSAEAPAGTPAAAAAPPAPAKGKGGAGNLKPAQKSKGKAADKPGGTK